MALKWENEDGSKRTLRSDATTNILKDQRYKDRGRSLSGDNQAEKILADFFNDFLGSKKNK